MVESVPWQVALGVWGTLLLGQWRRSGFRSMCSVLALGAAPTALLICLLSEKLAPLTGLYTKRLVEEEKEKASKKAGPMERKTSVKKESVEWFNLILQQMWPHIAKLVEGKIEGLQPMIQSKLPMLGASVHFEKVSLGDRPPRFEAMAAKLIDAYYDGQPVPDGGVALQMPLALNSNAKIVLSTAVGKIGIADFSINGELSLILRPFLDASPIIGGMEIMFTNPPKIEIEFSGLAAVAEMGSIKGSILNVIDAQIGKRMVIPNRMAFQIGSDPKVDLAMLRNPRPLGVLRLTILKAENLKAMDWKLSWKGKVETSDPYVKIRVGEQRFQTPIIPNSCDPVWKEGNTHDFFVYSEDQWVQFDVLDHDDHSADDPIGSIHAYPVRELIHSARRGELRKFLEPSNEADAPLPSGSAIFLEADWFKFGHRSDAVKPEIDGENKYCVSLKIDECIGLTAKGAPFTVRLRLKDKESGPTSNPGYARAEAQLTTPQTLESAHKLKTSGVEESVIAEVMNIDKDVVEDLLRNRTLFDESESGEKAKIRNRSRASTVAVDQMHKEEVAKAIEKITENRAERESARNPQFEEVLRDCMPSHELTVVVELISDETLRKKDKKLPEVVGSFEHVLSREGVNGIIEGPFAIKGAGDAAMFHGSIRTYQLQTADGIALHSQATQAF